MKKTALSLVTVLTAAVAGAAVMIVSPATEPADTRTEASTIWSDDSDSTIWSDDSDSTIWSHDGGSTIWSDDSDSTIWSHGA